MTGSWLGSASRHLLHEDTFELFVAPAIADLQHASGMTAYRVVWSSFVGALIHDLSGDIEHVLTDVGLMIGLVAMQTCYYGAMLLILVAHIRLDDLPDRLAHGGGAQFTATVVGVIAASALPTLLCFWPPRRVLDV